MLNLVHGIDPLYVFSGLVVGALVGFTGVGGGSLMTPILILLFGVHPSSAVGTDLIYASITKTAGSVVHNRNRGIDWRIVGLLALGSVPMTLLTILALYEVGIDSKGVQLLITRVLGIALFFTAMSLIFRSRLLRWHEKHIGELEPRLVSALTVATGAVLGVLVTISSVGAGAIGVTALVLLYPKLPSQRIVGTDIAHAVPLTLLAGLGHSILGTINLHILVSLLCGSLPGIVAASIAMARTPEVAVRATLATVLLLVCARFWLLA